MSLNCFHRSQTNIFDKKYIMASSVTEQCGALSQSRDLGSPLFCKSSLQAKPEITLGWINVLHQHNNNKEMLISTKKFHKISWGPPRGLIVWGPLVLRLKVHTSVTPLIMANQYLLNKHKITPGGKPSLEDNRI